MTWVRGGGMAGMNALELIDQFGPVCEVKLKENGEIEVVFASGQTAVLGSGFRYGYRGTGPDMFGGWLTTAGYSVTEESIEKMKVGMVLTRPQSEVAREWKEQQSRKQREREEEAKRQEEDERRKKIMGKRQAEGLCPLCGKPRTLMQKLFRKTEHPDCYAFTE